MSAVGAAVGLACGLGLALVLVAAPLGRRPDLSDRIAPYVGGAPARLRPAPPSDRRGRLLAVLAGLLDRGLGGGDAVQRRLARAGRAQAVQGFREEQLAWGAAALAGAVVLSAPAAAGGSGPGPGALVVLCAVATVAGMLARDRLLHRQVARREGRMLAELPTLAELLALAVSAGEGPAAALERVVSRGHGPLADEFGRALAEARSGVPLAEALGRIAHRSALPALARFVDGFAVALERGTPLADVLRAQAADAREAGRRELLEAGARREIAMMLPVVFLILPVTVLFALYPGWFALHLYTP